MGKEKQKPREKQMPKWKTIRVRQELVTAAKNTLENGRYRSLSDFVSEAIRLRLDELKQNHEKIAEKQVEYPLVRERLLYTPNHLWVMVTPEGNISVGLSDYAQRHLKGIADIQLQSVGHEVKKNEPFGVIETWMFMFDLYSPVSGKLAKINKGLLDDPFALNGDPFETIWIAEIKPSNLITLEEELRDLVRPSQYEMLLLELDRARILSI